MWDFSSLVHPECREDLPEAWCPCWGLRGDRIDPTCPEHGHLAVEPERTDSE